MRQKRDNQNPTDAVYLDGHDVTDAELIESLEGWLAYLVASDIKLPLMTHKSWLRVIACAKGGVNKGKKRRPPDTFLVKAAKEWALKSIVEFARERKAERFNNAKALREQASKLPKGSAKRRELERNAEKEGIKMTGGPNSAEDKAIEDALVYAQQQEYARDIDDWHTPAASTIRRRLQSKRRL